jgi:GAF domain-containing protein
MPAAKPAPDGNTSTRDARRLSTLLEVSQALSGTLNLKSSMQRVIQILIRHHGVVRGMVTLLREGELHASMTARAPSASRSGKALPARSSRAASRSSCRA